MARIIYVLIRGTTKVTEKLSHRWRPNLKLEATAVEARDIARPLARYMARRVDFVGDSNDTIDGLAFMFALGGFAARVAGIDPDNVEASDGFDGDMLKEVEEVVDTALVEERARRPVDVTATDKVGVGIPGDI